MDSENATEETTEASIVTEEPRTEEPESRKLISQYLNIHIHGIIQI